MFFFFIIFVVQKLAVTAELISTIPLKAREWWTMNRNWNFRVRDSMAGTGFGGAMAPTPLIRSWRTAFLTLRDEFLTNPPRNSTSQMLHNLIFSHSHTLLSAAPELPSHEVSMPSTINRFFIFFVEIFSLIFVWIFSVRFYRISCLWWNWLHLVLQMKMTVFISILRHHDW